MSGMTGNLYMHENGELFLLIRFFSPRCTLYRVSNGQIIDIHKRALWRLYKPLGSD